MNPTIKTTPKDFFLYLAATIVLYVSAIASVNLAMAVINYAFPDALASYFYSGSIAWPISMLVVLVPVLYVLEWMIKKDLAKTSEKDILWVRRWRIYLTLFLSGATIIGDLIVLINTYINGEVTERFVYKFLAILVIFSVIFVYYILERTASPRKGIQKILAWIGILIVLASIIGGFIITGSPYKQRALRLDNQRVNDLSNIQWQVVNYWQQKGELPANLESLKDPISGQTIPADPENRSQYEYNLNGPMSFEMCATFAEKSQDNRNRGGYSGGYMMSYPVTDGMTNENWMHEAGHTCFERTIDPERYPINKPKPVY
ncbi:MAG: DUF5671 domain-containing protein [bacterium]|nr:DUF5671 domain-containing protein [bacterium]